MNYEEMLNQREVTALRREKTLLGWFYKKKVEQKYRNVLELKPQLADSLLFCEGLRSDQQRTADVKDSRQMHYELHEDSGGIYELELETGNYITLYQLLDENPAVVAAKGFVDQLVEGLAELTAKLNSEGIYHLCYAPQNIFVTKSGYAPRLLCHGSSFLSMSDQHLLYEGYEDYMAPEVLNHGQVDERSEVYGVARLLTYLFGQGALPYEYKAAIKKATSEDPEKRFHTVADLRSAIAKKRGVLRSTIMLAAAVVIALLVIFLYIDMSPQPVVVEHEEHPKEALDPFFDDDDGLDDTYIDPDVLAMFDLDSLSPANLTDEEWKRLSDSVDHVQKVDEIFRRRFTQEAEKELSKIYSNEHMSAEERSIMAQQTMQSLMDKKDQMAEQAGMDQERAARIYSEVITKITTEKEKENTGYGYQPAGSGDDD